MCRRHQVQIPEELDAQIREAAQRSRLPKGGRARRILRELVPGPDIGGVGSDALTRLGSLRGPTADIEQMLDELVGIRRVKPD